mgnify:FL=1
MYNKEWNIQTTIMIYYLKYDKGYTARYTSLEDKTYFFSDEDMFTLIRDGKKYLLYVEPIFKELT